MNESLMRQEEEEESIDLLPLLMELKKRWLLIVFITLVGAALGFAAVKTLMTPTYRSSFAAYVNNSSAGSETQTYISSSDVAAAKSLAYTYERIISGRTVLTAAAEKANTNYSYKEMQQFVETDVDSNTEIIEVSVTCTSPAIAKALADAIASVAQAEVAEIVDGSSMRIVDYPVLPTEKYGPSTTKYTALGAIAGFVLCCGIIILSALMDDRIKDEETLERRFGIRVLESIPNLEQAMKNAVDDYEYGNAGRRSR